MLSLIHLHLADGNVLGEMKFARPETALFRELIVDGVEANPAEPDRIRVPILVVLDNGQDPVGFPLIKGEGPVADEVAGLGPFGAAFVHGPELLDGGAVDGEPGVVNLHGEEIGRRLVEHDFEMVVVDGANTDFREIGDLAFGEGFRVADAIEQVAVLAREPRR